MYKVRFREVIGFASLVFVAALPIAGCQSLGSFTPAQLAAVNCVLASDGATVVAVIKPGMALPANGLAKVGCDAGTQIGSIIGAGK